MRTNIVIDDKLMQDVLRATGLRTSAKRSRWGFERCSGYAGNFIRAKRLMSSLTLLDLAGRAVAIKAAENFRTLRSVGISVRKTIDTIIATHCIVNGLPLLYSDRDFAPFVTYLGLQPA